MNRDPRTVPLEALLGWYESLSPQSLGRIEEFYAPEATFRDPFNDVRGVAAIRRVFEHMFDATLAPRFEISASFASGSQAFAAWIFHFGIGARTFSVRGATHLVFDGAGRVAHHRDYWDAAEEFYEKLPVLGVLMRALRRRLRTPPAPQ